MENKNHEEIFQIITKFAKSDWDLIASPSKAWLEGNGSSKELLESIEQADKECGDCGCEFDGLYKKVLAMKEIF